MSKRIQVSDVPERLHGTLKARAAREGMSLSDFIKRELERAAERPTMREWLERTQQTKPIPRNGVPRKYCASYEIHDEGRVRTRNSRLDFQNIQCPGYRHDLEWTPRNHVSLESTWLISKSRRLRLTLSSQWKNALSIRTIGLSLLTVSVSGSR
jgi:antitoxin FitA